MLKHSAPENELLSDENKEAALFIAVQEGNIEAIHRLIDQGANIEAINKRGLTLLMVAQRYGQIEAIKALIKLGAVKKNPMLMLYLSNKMGLSEIEQAQKLSEHTYSVFIEALTNKKALPYPDNEGYNIYFDFLESQPLGSWKEELTVNLLAYVHSETKNNLLAFRYQHNDSYYLLLRIKCEEYVKSITIEDKKYELLKEIESIILKLKEDAFPKSGNKLPYEALNKGSLIKSVYLFEDASLTKLFAKHLPIPSVNHFESTKIPKYIAYKEMETKAAITHFLDKNKPAPFHLVEKKIIHLQKLYRKKTRQKEEQNRVAEKYSGQNTGQGLINTSENVYIPQNCSIELAKKIVKTSQGIKLFNEIRHETKQKALTSIFNNGFLGRKTLLMFLQEFSPASLMDGDIQDGDANVICFGSEYGQIDPMTKGEVELSFRLDSIDFGENKTIHCAFFKQQDLGFVNESIREVNINNNLAIAFEHTGMTRCAKTGYSYMHFSLGQENSFEEFNHISCIPNFKLISYDIKNIDSILILNFFRYLDNLVTYQNEDASDIRSIIYNAIDKMTEKELSVFLEQIGRNLSDTMEFNFYGAHLIDFDSLTKIKNMKSLYTLKMDEFIADLQKGSIEALLDAKKHFPTIFQSYRFLDYLSLKSDHPNILIELSTLRSFCKIPGWYPMNEKLKTGSPEKKRKNRIDAEFFLSEETKQEKSMTTDAAKKHASMTANLRRNPKRVSSFRGGYKV